MDCWDQTLIFLTLSQAEISLTSMDVVENLSTEQSLLMKTLRSSTRRRCIFQWWVNISLNGNTRFMCHSQTKSLLDHELPTYLPQANSGPNSNGSQFFITTVKTSWLDGKHVVFGKVLEGEELVKRIEAQGTNSGTPKTKVSIAESGELTGDEL